MLTTDESQTVFTDTPGFHKPRTLLGERLNRMVEDSAEGVDTVVLVVDAAAGVGRGDAFVASRRVAPLRCMKVCAVNKIDRLSQEQLIPSSGPPPLADFDHVIPVSARTGKGVRELVELLASVLPEGPPHFEPGQVTDQPLELRVAEIIREKALAATRGGDPPLRGRPGRGLGGP